VVELLYVTVERKLRNCVNNLLRVILVLKSTQNDTVTNGPSCLPNNINCQALERLLNYFFLVTNETFTFFTYKLKDSVAVSLFSLMLQCESIETCIYL